MDRKDRNKITPASYLLLEKDNKLLLSRRFNTGYEDGNYAVVSGHVEKGESPLACIVREAKEEAGITVLPENLKLVNVLSYNAQDNERIGFFWSCGQWEGEVINLELDKCDDLSWFNKDNLPDNLTPDLKIALESLQQNQSYSELNWN